MPSFVIAEKCDGCKGGDKTACMYICPNDLMVLDPNWELYEAVEERGNLLAMAAHDDDGRMTGMVMYNFASPQGGWFFNQNSLGALDVLTIGAGYDTISRSGATAEDHEAWSVFFTMEKTLGAGHVSFNGTYIDWEGVVGGFGDGTSTSIQAAFLPTGSKWQPVLRWQQQDPDNGSTLDTIGIGLAYYLSGHRVNIKAEYSIDDQFVDGSEVDAFRIQTQLFF
jgi:hypothetical protein